jgi:putative DNA primase/helicase
MPIDFQAIAADLLSQARSLLPQWFPQGRFMGREFVVGNLAGDPGGSLSINTETGQWADFAGGARGGDLVALYAAMKGISQADAARQLSGSSSQPRTPARKPPARKTTIGLPPADAPSPDFSHKVHGPASSHWTYRTADGQVIGHISRHDPRQPGDRKQIIPWVWNVTDRRWCNLSFEKPRPLYGLDLLAANKTAPVLIVEGEKAADAARQIVGDRYVVITWPGGSKAAHHVDWTPAHGRRLLLWPDADRHQYGSGHAMAGQQMPYEEQPGHAVMVQIAGLLRPHCPEIKILDVQDVEADGWDAADALAEGWDWPRLLEWARPRARVCGAMPVDEEPEPEMEEPGECEPGPPPQQYDAFVPITLGQRDAYGRLVLSKDRTLPTAVAYVEQFHRHPQGLMTLHYHAGRFLAWENNRWAEMEDAALKAKIHPWLHNSVQQRLNKQTGEYEASPFPDNSASINNAIDALRNHTMLTQDVQPACWLSGDSPAPDLDPNHIIACRSFLLHLPTMQRIEPTPRYFNTAALPFDHDPSAGLSSRWVNFLQDLWDDDLESMDLLQEWFGYCLAPDTSQQKMMLIVGPKRSGKGTIARILRALVGEQNVAGPTVESIGEQFGLQQLIGKSLAIVSDARFSGNDIQIITERLLCISGEDTLTIRRMYTNHATMKLPTRFTFLSNELPRFADASGALVGRFVMLKLEESFYGREDPKLTPRLLEELPGILNWAIEGWHRLKERGRFKQPTISEQMLQEMDDLASPVSAFVRDRCEVCSGHRVSTDELYAAWKTWCESEGKHPTAKNVFSRDLTAAFQRIRRIRNSHTGDSSYEGISLRGSAGALDEYPTYDHLYSPS